MCLSFEEMFPEDLSLLWLFLPNCPLKGAEENKGMLAKGKGQHTCEHTCAHTRMNAHTDVLSGKGKCFLGEAESPEALRT